MRRYDVIIRVHVVHIRILSYLPICSQLQIYSPILLTTYYDRDRTMSHISCCSRTSIVHMLSLDVVQFFSLTCI